MRSRSCPHFLLPTGLLALGAPAVACDCANLTVPEAFEEASAVFRGVAIAVQRADSRVHVTFTVGASWKGPCEPTAAVFTSDNEAICGFPFRLGGDYLVFAADREPLELWTNICSGTRDYDPDAAAALGTPPCTETLERSFLRGDADGDGDLNLTDGIRILDHLFSGGSPPPCIKAADADDSGKLEITDAIHLLAYLFSSGPPPGGSLFGIGALDPTPDDLSCDTYNPCA